MVCDPEAHELSIGHFLSLSDLRVGKGSGKGKLEATLAKGERVPAQAQAQASTSNLL